MRAGRDAAWTTPAGHIGQPGGWAPGRVPSPGRRRRRARGATRPLFHDRARWARSPRANRATAGATDRPCRPSRSSTGRRCPGSTAPPRTSSLSTPGRRRPAEARSPRRLRGRARRRPARLWPDAWLGPARGRGRAAESGPRRRESSSRSRRGRGLHDPALRNQERASPRAPQLLDLLPRRSSGLRASILDQTRIVCARPLSDNRARGSEAPPGAARRIRRLNTLRDTRRPIPDRTT